MENQQSQGETFFQIGSVSIPIEKMILDYIISLDLITLEITEEIINEVNHHVFLIRSCLFRL